MARLMQLAGVDDYRPCDWDLRADAAGRAHWDARFRWHLDDVLLPMIEQEYADATPQRRAAFRRDFLALFDRIAAHPERYDRVDVLFLSELRAEVQAHHGFDDPFRGFKRRENDAALELLPGVLAELDAAAPDEQRELLTLGLMAGNIVDLGSRAAVERYREGSMAFRQARAGQPPRPWHCDDVAAWWPRWEVGPGYRQAVFFVDNAGADLLLGCLPLARWMLEAGARVTLAANTGPALNDITAAELEPLLERCAQLDARLGAAIREARLRTVATGTRAPLLDLTRLSAECVAAARDADLVMLHGMGRAVESNFHARFRCDALWTAVLKDEAVAARMGGRLFDCVLRFRRETE